MTAQMEVLLFFIAQSIIIGGLIVGAYVALRVEIAKIQVTVENLEQGHDEIKSRQDNFLEKYEKTRQELHKIVQHIRSSGNNGHLVVEET